MIKHAAIRQNGIVYIGHRHHNCIATMVECGLPTPIAGEQGFVDDEGNFLTREEALKVARECGQIREKHGSPDELYSEDIY